MKRCLKCNTKYEVSEAECPGCGSTSFSNDGALQTALRDLTNQAPPKPEAPLADLGARFQAAFLDKVLVAVPLGIMLVGTQTEDAKGVLFALAAVLLVSLCIFQWYRISTTGQSIGKKAIGVQIVKLDGSRVDFSTGVGLRAWLPAAIAAIPIVGVVFVLADVLAIFGNERRCLHDQMAGTKVVVAGQQY